MKTRTFYLTDRQIEALEELVKDTDMTMAEHVRRAIDDYLKKLKKEENRKNAEA